MSAVGELIHAGTLPYRVAPLELRFCDSADPRPCARALTDRVVDVTPTLDGFDVTVHRGEVRAHRHDRYVAPPCIAPRRDIARPLVVPATVLLDRLEAEFIVSPSELDKLGLDPRLDLRRLGLSPAREQESVPILA